MLTVHVACLTVLPSLRSAVAQSSSAQRRTHRVMGSKVKSRPDGYLIAIIGDEDTATGFLLAGVGDKEGTNGSNYFVVDPKNTPVPAIEEAFKKFVERDDIAILLINQYIADKIRGVISKFNEPMPAILEIPSKEHPYDPNKDYILQRVRGMLGSSS